MKSVRVHMALVLLLWSSGLWGEVNQSPHPPVSVDELSRETVSRISRVKEFDFLREQAERLGVRVWLFGGSASALAHYTKWDLQQEKGDQSLQPQRFDYDFANIFRSNQDIDVVMDGNAEQAAKLQTILEATYPYQSGERSSWEVRLLRQQMGAKEALLNNPNFENQHTDSNSTGLIEVTQPPQGESPILDLRDWGNPTNQFLKDVVSGTLHYYHSPNHFQTDRAKQGLNPPILSAIRYLTKAFQYDLRIPDESMRHIKKIIFEFDRSQIKQQYVSGWIEKNGKKLLHNAVDVEYAWNTLEELGLRTKLIALSDPTVQGSLGWWLNKEPLRSRPVGEGTGKTARELGVSKIAHETRDLEAYESITRSHRGSPNVFISRKNAIGEAAQYGNGFYAMVGSKGARDTQITVRLNLHPDARRGTDFLLDYNDTLVVLLNKNAATVIPESINLSPVEFFEAVANGEQFATDHAQVAQFKRKLLPRLNSVSPQEEKELIHIVRRAIHGPTSTKNVQILKDWFSLPISAKHPELVDEVFGMDGHTARYNPSQIDFLDQFRLRHWAESPEASHLFTSLLDHEDFHPVIEKLFSSKAWVERPDAVQLLQLALESHPPQSAEALSLGASDPSWTKHEGFVKALSQLYQEPSAEINLDHLVKTIWSRPEWVNHPELAAQIDRWLLNRSQKSDQQSAVPDSLTTHIFNNSDWAAHPNAEQWLKSLWAEDKKELLTETLLIQKPWLDQIGIDFIRSAVAQKQISEEIYVKNILPHSESLSEIITYLNKGHVMPTVENIMSLPRWKARASDYGSLLANLSEKVSEADVAKAFIEHVLSDANFARRPDSLLWLSRVRLNGLENELADLLSQPEWIAKPEVQEIVTEMVDKDPALFSRFFPSSAKPTSFALRLLIRHAGKQNSHAEVIKTIAQPSWLGHDLSVPVIERLIQTETASALLMKSVLFQPGWLTKDKAADLMTKALVNSSGYAEGLLYHLQTNPEWFEHSKISDTLLRAIDLVDANKGATLLSLPGIGKQGAFFALFERYYKKHGILPPIDDSVFDPSTNQWKNRAKWADLVLKVLESNEYNRNISDWVFRALTKLPEIASTPEAKRIVEILVEKGENVSLLTHLWPIPQWRKMGVAQAALSRSSAAESQPEDKANQTQLQFLAMAHSTEFPSSLELFEKFLKAEDASHVTKLLAEEHWKTNAELLPLFTKVIKEGPENTSAADTIVRHLNENPELSLSPHSDALVSELFRHEANFERIRQLDNELWMVHPGLQQAELDAIKKMNPESFSRFIISDRTRAPDSFLSDLVAEHIQLKPEAVLTALMGSEAWRSTPSLFEIIAHLPEKAIQSADAKVISALIQTLSEQENLDEIEKIEPILSNLALREDAAKELLAQLWEKPAWATQPILTSLTRSILQRQTLDEELATRLVGTQPFQQSELFDLLTANQLRKGEIKFFINLIKENAETFDVEKRLAPHLSELVRLVGAKRIMATPSLVRSLLHHDSLVDPAEKALLFDVMTLLKMRDEIVSSAVANREWHDHKNFGNWILMAAQQEESNDRPLLRHLIAFAKIRDERFQKALLSILKINTLTLGETLSLLNSPWGNSPIAADIIESLSKDSKNRLNLLRALLITDQKIVEPRALEMVQALLAEHELHGRTLAANENKDAEQLSEVTSELWRQSKELKTQRVNLRQERLHRNLQTALDSGVLAELLDVAKTIDQEAILKDSVYVREFLAEHIDKVMANKPAISTVNELIEFLAPDSYLHNRIAKIALEGIAFPSELKALKMPTFPDGKLRAALWSLRKRNPEWPRPGLIARTADVCRIALSKLIPHRSAMSFKAPANVSPGPRP